jgi:hypothetical protein
MPLQMRLARLVGHCSYRVESQKADKHNIVSTSLCSTAYLDIINIACDN